MPIAQCGDCGREPRDREFLARASMSACHLGPAVRHKGSERLVIYDTVKSRRIERFGVGPRTRARVRSQDVENHPPSGAQPPPVELNVGDRPARQHRYAGSRASYLLRKGRCERSFDERAAPIHFGRELRHR